MKTIIFKIVELFCNFRKKPNPPINWRKIYRFQASKFVEFSSIYEVVTKYNFNHHQKRLIIQATEFMFFHSYYNIVYQTYKKPVGILEKWKVDYLIFCLDKWEDEWIEYSMLTGKKICYPTNNSHLRSIFALVG